MNVPDIELHEPRSLSEAAALITEHGPTARFLAGGTDLLVDLKTGRIQTDHVVSLNRIHQLRGITSDGSGLRIGALTTPNELAASELVCNGFSAMVDATRDMAAPQVRNMATVGGNIASAIPSADLPPILLVMNASVVLWSVDGERSVPLDAYFTGPRQSVRKQEEILTEIIVPHPPALFGAAYSRFALRSANACAVAGVAASLQLGADGKICEARIAMGAVAPTPKMVPDAASAIVGEIPSEGVFSKAAAAAMSASSPIDDVRGSADYRRDLVGILTQRALASATQRAREVKS